MKDVSIRQQLGIGFAVLGGILTALVLVVLLLNAQSAEAERTFVEEVEPRRERAAHLERSIMYVGLGFRSYLLSPDPARLQRFYEASEEVRRATEEGWSSDDDVVRTLRYRVRDYLKQVGQAVDRNATSPLSRGEELTLAAAREKLLLEIRGVAQNEDAQARTALASMAEVRRQVSRGVLGACVFAMLGFVVLWTVMSRTMARATREILAAASALVRGNWKPALAWAESPGEVGRAEPRGEMGKIARAFGAAAWHLERREQRLKAEGEIATIAAASLDPRQLGGDTLRAVADYLGAEVGAVYLPSRDGQSLCPHTTHALDGDAEVLRLGEGLPGQAGKERRTQVSRDIPKDSGFQVKLGYDAAPPRCVVATPAVTRDTLQGVLLVASLRDLDDEAVAFLEHAAAQLAMGLANAAAYDEAQVLLAEVRERNEVIQSQNEELQAQNEEIQAQSEELQAQGEELQAQSDQLQTQHEEIELRNQELQRRAEDLEAHAMSLKDADERKTEFLSVLAHELRNPLAPIVNGLFLLRRTGSQSEAGQRALAAIERQTEHLTKLIDDLLDVARIARGKVRLERKPLDLAELIRTCVDDHRPSLENKQLQLNLALPGEPIMVDGDRTRLSQIISNLLSNAIKFTDPGGSVGLQLRCEAAEVCLLVSDSGVGIEAPLMDVLFTPFSQGPNSLARTGGGLGLGLALVKSLTVLHGGSVQAQSAGVGQGASFLVTLPRWMGAVPERKVELAPPSASPLRVLIIEDNSDVAQTLRDALEVEGHKVEVAYTGQDGLERAVVMEPEVVLCDLGLPLLDGYEVARRLRNDPRFSRVLLVAISGYASPADQQQAAAAGFDTHLAKPPSLERLRELFARRTQFSGPR